MEFGRALFFAMKKFNTVIDKHIGEFNSEIVRPRVNLWIKEIMAEAEQAKYSDYYGRLIPEEQNQLRRLYSQGNMPARLMRVFGISSIEPDHSIITDLPNLYDIFETVYRNTADIWVDVFMVQVGQYDIRYMIDKEEIDSAFTALIDGRTTEEYFARIISKAADRLSAALLSVLVMAKSAREAHNGARQFSLTHTAQIEREIRLGVEHKLLQARNGCIESLNHVLSSGITVQYDRLEAVANG